MRQDFITLKYKFLFPIAVFFFSFFISIVVVQGQNWQWVEQFGTMQSETVDAMQTDGAGNIYLSGKFKDSFDWGANSLQSIGKDDVYLTKLDAQGNVVWAKKGGSEESDESIALALDAAANIYQTGHYWFEADFDAIHLESTPGSRAIYLMKYDNSGNVLWGKSINGTAAKTVSSLATDSAGNIYLSGSFKGELILDGLSITASDQGDIFVAKFNAAGQLDWAKQVAASFSIKAHTIAVAQNDDVLVAGQFIGEINFAGDQFVNITGDNDVFLLKYSNTGTPIWARKAGGVHEDDCSQIQSDASGNIYLTGTFVGVMELSPTVQIQTQGFNNNFYLLKYDPNGNILWARSLGGTANDGAEDMIVNESLIVVSGYFTEAMTIDGINVTSNENFGDGFIAAFDLDGIARKILPISSEGFVIANNLSFTPNEAIISSGVFEKTAQFDTQALTSAALFDIYVAKIGDDFTGFTPVNALQNRFKLFPNPTQDKLFIETNIDEYHYKLYDSSGRLLQSGGNARAIELMRFPNGLYFIQLQNQRGEMAQFTIQKQSK